MSLAAAVKSARLKTDKELGNWKRAVAFMLKLRRMETKALLRRQHEALRFRKAK